MTKTKRPHGWTEADEENLVLSCRAAIADGHDDISMGATLVLDIIRDSGRSIGGSAECTACRKMLARFDRLMERHPLATCDCRTCAKSREKHQRVGIVSDKHGWWLRVENTDGGPPAFTMGSTPGDEAIQIGPFKHEPSKPYELGTQKVLRLLSDNEEAK